MSDAIFNMPSSDAGNIHVQLSCGQAAAAAPHLAAAAPHLAAVAPHLAAAAPISLTLLLERVLGTAECFWSSAGFDGNQEDLGMEPWEIQRS